MELGVNTQTISDIKESRLVPLKPFVQNDRDKQVRLSQHVFSFVVNGIIAGRLSPNQKISQRFLGDQLQVSQFPIREALEQLEQDGWVKRLAKKGTFVKEFSLDEITSAYQIREIVEAEAIEALAKTITPEQIEQLKKIESWLEDSDGNATAEQFAAKDAEFHRFIVHALSNERINAFYESALLQTCYFTLIAFLPSGAVNVNITFPENPRFNHRCVLDALSERNERKVKMLLRTHIRNGCEVAKKLCKARHILR